MPAIEPPDKPFSLLSLGMLFESNVTESDVAVTNSGEELGVEAAASWRLISNNPSSTLLE